MTKHFFLEQFVTNRCAPAMYVQSTRYAITTFKRSKAIMPMQMDFKLKFKYSLADYISIYLRIYIKSIKIYYERLRLTEPATRARIHIYYIIHSRFVCNILTSFSTVKPNFLLRPPIPIQDLCYEYSFKITLTTLAKLILVFTTFGLLLIERK